MMLIPIVPALFAIASAAGYLAVPTRPGVRTLLLVVFAASFFLTLNGLTGHAIRLGPM